MSRNGYAWVVYEWAPGVMCAAVYVAGRLLRHDLRGWWVADYHGKRQPVVGDPVAALHDTVPDGWPIHPEQVDLLVAEVPDRG